jgi:hypothetical protein
VTDFMSGMPARVARMERSVIRGQHSALARAIPDYAALHPGYTDR